MKILTRLTRSARKSGLTALCVLSPAILTFILAVDNYITQNKVSTGSQDEITERPTKPPELLSIWNPNVLGAGRIIGNESMIDNPNFIFRAGTKLAQAALAMNNKYGLEKFINVKSWDEIHYDYPPFNLSEPLFISEEDRTFFWRDKLNREFASIYNKEQLTGIVKLLEHSRYGPRLDCGWRSDLSTFAQKDKLMKLVMKKAPAEYTVHCPLLVPESDAFQHFLDGTVPKLLQVLPFLLQQKVTLVIYTYGSNQIIPGILKRLGLPKDRVTLFTLSEREANEIYAADYQINSCIAPPLHPILIQTLHTMIDAPWELPLTTSESLVVLLTRIGARNPGRMMSNRQEVTKFLKSRYDYRLHVYAGAPSFERAASIFNNAAIIIGVHGGAFYNINFSSRNTTVVEIMPVWDDEYPNLAHSMVWRMADSLGQTYWRINQQALNYDCNVRVDIAKLKQVLDKVDKTYEY